MAWPRLCVSVIDYDNGCHAGRALPYRPAADAVPLAGRCGSALKVSDTLARIYKLCIIIVKFASVS